MHYYGRLSYEFYFLFMDYCGLIPCEPLRLWIFIFLLFNLLKYLKFLTLCKFCGESKTVVYARTVNLLIAYQGFLESRVQSDLGQGDWE